MYRTSICYRKGADVCTRYILAYAMVGGISLAIETVDRTVILMASFHFPLFAVIRRLSYSIRHRLTKPYGGTSIVALRGSTVEPYCKRIAYADYRDDILAERRAGACGKPASCATKSGM
ncbi:hypothetical protein F5Y10DRAFT_250488 [Nemania abortiva]|nr:hypothetical protein F5Y10DRAFT_250488 [Nemania abortiva]